MFDEVVGIKREDIGLGIRITKEKLVNFMTTQALLKLFWEEIVIARVWVRCIKR